MTTEKHKKTKKKSLFEALPKSVDQSNLLQNAVNLLHEVQKQAVELKQGNNEEINKLIVKLKDSYQDLGLKVAVVSDEAKKQAKEGVSTLVQTWHKNKSQLPNKLTGEIDRLLDKVGLVRKAKPTKPATKVKEPVVKAKPKVKTAVKAKATAKSKSDSSKKSNSAPKKTEKVASVSSKSNASSSATML